MRGRHIQGGERIGGTLFVSRRDVFGSHEVSTHTGRLPAGYAHYTCPRLCDAVLCRSSSRSLSGETSAITTFFA